MAAAVSEREVADLWAELRFDPEPLARLPGGPYTLVFRGWPNHGPGPDFRQAILADPRGHLIRGDVEIHGQATDWWAHGHHLDPEYDNVILHVVAGPANVGPVPLAGGRLAPTVGLTPALVNSRRGDPPDVCRESARGRGVDDILVLLDRAGAERLQQKADRLEAEIAACEPAEVLYTALLEALGYSANVAPMRRLAERLPLAVLEDYCAGKPREVARVLAEALLLQAGGLLPAAALPESAVGDYLAELNRVVGRDRLAGLAGEPLSWSRRGVRPENAPPRRLAGLAALIAACAGPGLLATVLDCLEGAPAREASRRLEGRLTVAAAGFWADRCDFQRRLPECALIGAERARILLVDALLPFVMALGATTDNQALIGQANAVFARVPRLPANQVTRRLLEQIDSTGALRRHLTAQRQQGLIHLWRTSCAQRRCADCPIAGKPNPPPISGDNR